MKSVIFTFAMTYGGALFSLVRPWYGFLIYMAFGIIKPDSLWWYSVPEGNYSRIVAIGFLLGWALNGCGDWRFGRGWGIIGCLVGYWVYIAISAAGASNAALAWEPIEPLAKVILPIVAGATLLDSVAKLKQLVWVIVICQGYVAYELNLQYFFWEGFVAAEMAHGGMDNNSVAITMVSSIGMAFFLGMHAEKLWQQGVAFVCAALMLHVVLFSNSRGGMLSLIVTAGFAFLLLPKRPLHMLVFALAVAGGLATTGEQVHKRFMSAFASKEEGGDEGGGRKEFWKGCLRCLDDHPLGVGPNHWLVVAPNYGLPARPAHSTWLQLGAELGLPGLAVLLGGIYLQTVWRLYPFLKDRYPVADPWYRYAARMVICSTLGYIVSAQFVTLDRIELPLYVVLAGVGVLRLHSADRAWAAAAQAGPLVPERL